MSGWEEAMSPIPEEERPKAQTMHPVPEGEWPKGMAWFPLLGEWGPSGGLFGDVDMDDAAFFDPDLDAPDYSLDGDDLPPHLWRTYKNEILQIKNLETSHLRNILRLIERKNPTHSLAKIAARIPRVRCLTDEWLSRF